MQVLITSGGTQVDIDSIRVITNKSKGGFGSNLALQAVKSGNKVHHIYSGKTPFDVNINLANAKEGDLGSFIEKFKIYMQFGNNYSEDKYRTYQEYAYLLGENIDKRSPDIIILSAAVSDYAPIPVDGKIRSDKDKLNIELTQLPKIISTIRYKEKKRSYLVGFKLLSNVPEMILVSEGAKLQKANDLDLVVANDWANLINGKHKLYLIKNQTLVMTINENLDEALWDFIEKDYIK